MMCVRQQNSDYWHKVKKKTTTCQTVSMLSVAKTSNLSLWTRCCCLYKYCKLVYVTINCICLHEMFHRFHMPACFCVCICVEFVSTQYEQVSVSFPRGLFVTRSTDLILCCRGDALFQGSCSAP